MASRLRLLLYPFSLLFSMVVWFRNFCFNKGWYKSTQFEVPVISIGNITVGGTGKTPHTEYLAKLLGDSFQVGMVSRGYLRKTKGVVVATPQSTSIEIGDEPLQMKQKFTTLEVVVAEKRVEGIDKCLSLPSKPNVVLLDDAHQHRHVKPGLSIVLVDYNRPVWTDYMLPMGNLREQRSGLNRADIVIVTKCPESLSASEAKSISTKLRLRNGQTLYFTAFRYGTPYPLAGSGQKSFATNNNSHILAFTAIANAKPFHRYLSTLTPHLYTMELPDHHRFTLSDVDQAISKFGEIENNEKWIAVTEKDAVKLREIKQLPLEIVSMIWVFPIEPKFLFSEKNTFNAQILNYVGKC